jgi:hypothetical protein
LRRAEVAISGFVLSGGLGDVPDVQDGDNRGDALSGQ